MQPAPQNPPLNVLATDLDGTLIPLADNPQNRRDLAELANPIQDNDITLAFVTGRHLESVQDARTEYALPRPDWIICDVGTSIYHLDDADGPVFAEAYADHLADLIAGFPLSKLKEIFADLSELRLQEDEKQGRFKLSYYADAEQLEMLARELEQRITKHSAPYSLIASVDPFNGDGLIDLLPKNVSKAHALNWWSDHVGRSREAVVFAGDSGNDTAALTAGYRAIVVGNADRKVARNVYDVHKQNGWHNRLYLATESATSGLLAGCRWFELLPSDDIPQPKLTCGANPMSVNRTHFRVWSPHRDSVSVAMENGEEFPLERDREHDACFTGVVNGIGPGSRYRYRLDQSVARPDPVSRFQPDGVHGPSQVVHPNGFAWTDQSWQGVAKRDLVIYELHIGTFTQEGTFPSAIAELDRLKELGITAVELLPVAQTPGRWNWGYDGVDLFAPRNSFGTPDDFKAFVDAAHAMGIAVLLDVVYNHVGPEGNYWADFAPYYSEKHKTPWGDAFQFEGATGVNVREFVVQNALYWLREYHLDGLRLDAVHCMHDDSSPHILEDIRIAVDAFRQSVKHPIHLMAEANIYDPELLPPASDAPGYDAIWCDDIMHSVYAVISPETNVTHREYRGGRDLAESLEHGYIYQGMPQLRLTGELRRQQPVAPSIRESFVIALQNHDNVGNHPHGKRIHQLTSPAHQKAAAALVLLDPAIPLIFMGEETANSSPFRFFVDFEDDRLRGAVDEGRAREYPDQIWEGAISPSDERAFYDSVLSASDDPQMCDWYRALLDMRRDWIKKGILAGERLDARCDLETNLYSLHYQTEAETHFVVALLSSAGEPAANLELRVEGEWLLDSAGPVTPETKLLAAAPRVLVGRGTLNFEVTRDSGDSA